MDALPRRRYRARKKIIPASDGLPQPRSPRYSSESHLSEPEEYPLGALPKLSFPSWVPPAVIATAQQLHAELAIQSDQAKSLEVLKRLTSDVRMERVWRELYKKNRDKSKSTQNFFHPACVSNASIAARN